jgi:6-phosphogluconolactonase
LADSVAASNPSYLCIAPSGSKVYAISEDASRLGGSVAAYDFNSSTAKLKEINRQPTGGNHPCFVSIDAKATFIAVANYTGGSASMLPINAAGGLLPSVQVIQKTGSGPLIARQEKPHVHQTVFSPKQDYLLVADLGTDEITAYPYHYKKAQPLDTQNVIKVKLSGGAGPRHIVFHPVRPIFYVNEELSGKVSVHAFNKKNISLLQTIENDTISSHPGSADIHISPDGKFLYASNRADANNISIFKVNESDGRLTRIGSQPVLGISPRNFVIHPSGKWLLVANQVSNQVVVFSRDIQTGLLTPAGKTLNLPTPVCLVFAND